MKPLLTRRLFALCMAFVLLVTACSTPAAPQAQETAAPAATEPQAPQAQETT